MINVCRVCAFTVAIIGLVLIIVGLLAAVSGLLILGVALTSMTSFAHMIHGSPKSDFS
jgi:hypothetical protein